MTGKEQLIAELRDLGVEFEDEIFENTDEKVLKGYLEARKLVKAHEDEDKDKDKDKDKDVDLDIDKDKDEPDELDTKIEEHLKAKYEDFDEIKAHMQAMAAETIAAKKKLVDALVANKNCQVDKEALEEMKPDTLRQLKATFEPGSYLGTGVPQREPEAVPAPPAIVLNKKEDGEE